MTEVNISSYQKIKKFVLDSDVHKELITQKFISFLNVVGWKIDDNHNYVLKVFINNSTKHSLLVIDQEILGTINLLNFIYKIVLNRSRAINISKLRMRSSDDTYDMMIHRKTLFGEHINNYSKLEIMFGGNPSSSNIFFGDKTKTYMYNVDEILSTNYEKFIQKKF